VISDALAGIHEIVPTEVPGETESVQHVRRTARGELERRLGDNAMSARCWQIAKFVNPIAAPTLVITPPELLRLVQEHLPPSEHVELGESPPPLSWMTADEPDPLGVELNAYGRACRELVRVPPAEFDALKWWKEHERSFPKVATIAKRWLAVPPSSADLERLFTTAGWLARPHRNRLSGGVLRALLLLHTKWKRDFFERVRRRKTIPLVNLTTRAMKCEQSRVYP